MRPYGVPKHRHLSEIEQELSILAGEKVVIQFTPHLVPVNRGIITTIYVDAESKRLWLIDPTLHFQQALTARNRLSVCSATNVCPTPRMSSAQTSSTSHGGSTMRTGRIDRDERDRQHRQRRKRPGGAMFQSDVRFSRDRRPANSVS